VYYAGYEFSREWLNADTGDHAKSPYNDAIAGCFAECASSIFGIPSEVVKQRAQTQRHAAPPVRVVVPGANPYSYTAPAPHQLEVSSHLESRAAL